MLAQILSHFQPREKFKNVTNFNLRSSKIYENSFLKNGIIEFLSKALIVYNRNYEFSRKITKIVIKILQENSDNDRYLQKYF